LTGEMRMKLSTMEGSLEAFMRTHNEMQIKVLLAYIFRSESWTCFVSLKPVGATSQKATKCAEAAHESSP
jgi:hypothetical protein